MRSYDDRFAVKQDGSEWVEMMTDVGPNLEGRLQTYRMSQPERTLTMTVRDIPEGLEGYTNDLAVIFQGMIDLLLKKRQSYGPAKNLVRFGEMGLVIRASDKIDRLANMAKNGTSLAGDGEGRDDAWMDLIGYGALALLPETKLLLSEV